MEQRPRIYYTESQKALMWERCRRVTLSSRLPSCLIETTRRCRAFWCRRVGYVPRNDTARD